MIAEPSGGTSLGSLLGNRRYTLYLFSRVSLIIATQMLSVAVGWQVYEITNRALALGLSGLALFIPGFLLALPGGHLADVRDRRTILLVCYSGVALSAATLAFIAYSGHRGLIPIYGVLLVLGAIRAFSGPASQALVPNLVAKPQLGRAVAFGSSCWQLAMIVGPSLGGVLYAATGRAEAVYAVAMGMALVATGAVAALGHDPRMNAPQATGPATFRTVLAGVRYVWSQKPILGAISLDLFAVLLGGAVALLPIFAKDLLRVGPWGFGLLRSAPGVGASITAMWLAWFPLRRRAGITMFAGVFVFGIVTIVFGLSRTLAVSLVALLVLGAADMLSVVVRSTLLQIRTPDEMRGRVGAVNMVFIGASNELGELESGVTAAWLGPELAVLVGGIGTCLVVVVWMLIFPQLRTIDRLEDPAS